MRFLNWAATTSKIGMKTRMMSASRQLMTSIKIKAVVIFKIPQVISSKPQVTKLAIRSESEVTRDIIQPTGVLE